MNIYKHLKHQLRTLGNRGVAMVEVAIGLTFFILITFGLIELCRFTIAWGILSNVSSKGADFVSGENPYWDFAYEQTWEHTYPHDKYKKYRQLAVDTVETYLDRQGILSSLVTLVPFTYPDDTTKTYRVGITSGAARDENGNLLKWSTADNLSESDPLIGTYKKLDEYVTYRLTGETTDRKVSNGDSQELYLGNFATVTIIGEFKPIIPMMKGVFPRVVVQAYGFPIEQRNGATAKPANWDNGESTTTTTSSTTTTTNKPSEPGNDPS